MNNLKVALIQQKAVPNNVKKNLKLGIKYMHEAKRLGADIVLFPEMWSNGYSQPFEGALDNPYEEGYDKERQAWFDGAVDEDSDFIRDFRQTAKELDIGVVITYLSKNTHSSPGNTALFIDNNGDILMEYSKVHTCDFSLEGLLQSGDSFKVCNFKGVKMGIMICYDREFPESARVLMLEGAEIILVPNACDMNPARLNQLSTRAFENMVGIAMANYPGEKCGNSCAYSPIVFNKNGEYIDNEMFRAQDEEEDIFIIDFDMDAIRDYRRRETWGNAFRKVKAYAKLLDEKVEEPFVRKNKTLF